MKKIRCQICQTPPQYFERIENVELKIENYTVCNFQFSILNGVLRRGGGVLQLPHLYIMLTTM
jgi:hypothetical protein